MGKRLNFCLWLSASSLSALSLSLKTFLRDNFSKQYRNGRKLFLAASELDAALIPEEPCFTLEQALDENWLPSRTK